MDTHLLKLTAFSLALSAVSALCSTHYVDASGTNSTPPYSNWLTAATIIQDAIDIAATGDEIVVTNGLYSAGGKAVAGVMTNRVAVTKSLTLRSVNGPEFTVIQGYQVPETTNGDGAIRCVYLTNGATLSGFTLTSGATRWGGSDPIADGSGGGLWCESAGAVVSNCVVTGNAARFWGGGAFAGTLNDCTLNHNSASLGGGASLATLNYCLIFSNTATEGGGAYGSKLNYCTLNGNFAGAGGGGAYGGALSNCTLSNNTSGRYAFYDGGGGASSATLSNCTLTRNSASDGGGTFASALDRCTLIGNAASHGGGGAAGGKLSNCTLTGNRAAYGGGATFAPGDWTPIQVTLDNCTLTDNSATNSGGGVAGVYLGVAVNNCILYLNTATNGANYDAAAVLNYCCSTPMPTNGVGNITNAPLFANFATGDLRQLSNSPCINAGRNAYMTNGADRDGNPRIVSGTVDIGAYEFQGSGSQISYAWLQQYGLTNDGSADFTDPDGDRINNWREWRCLTDPTNSLSALRLLSATPVGSNVTVNWQSVAGVNYFLERSTDLTASGFQSLATNLPGQTGTTAFSHTNTAGTSASFYRVGVP